MERVPFAFCQSVVSLLTFDGYRGKHGEGAEHFSNAAWQNAIDELFADRVIVRYCIGYKDGVWSYAIWREADNPPSEHISFEELQNLNRRNLRIAGIQITILHSDHRTRASFDDITNLVKFALPSVNMTYFLVFNTKKLPQKDLLKLLSLLRDSSIECLSAGDNCEETWAALSVHLKSDSLKVLEIRDEEVPPK